MMACVWQMMFGAQGLLQMLLPRCHDMGLAPVFTSLSHHIHLVGWLT